MEASGLEFGSGNGSTPRPGSTGAGPLLYGAVATAQYRHARVLTFLNPGAAPTEATWQVQQSLTGIGAGRLFGVGFGQGQQKLGYLPYAYSDFIFSTIGEEWGFIGVLAIALLFGTFVWLGFRIARRAASAFFVPAARAGSCGCRKGSAGSAGRSATGRGTPHW